MSNGKAKSAPSFEPNRNGPSEDRGRDYSRRPVDPISWSDISNQELRDAVCAITDQGAAILLGTTTDRGALSITVLDGDQRIREWPHTAEETSKVLRWLVAMFSSQ